MQSMRRSRSVLVELTIAVLFLAITACVLAQLFVTAWETGKTSRATQASLLIARDVLERFSAGEELPESWAQTVGDEVYQVKTHVTSEAMDVGRMNHCRVTVAQADVIYAELETTGYVMGELENESE